MATIEERKANAAECLRMARTAESKKIRDILFNMARTWETMAKQAARLAQEREAEAGKK
jgi:hypothetical protein